MPCRRFACCPHGYRAVLEVPCWAGRHADPPPLLFPCRRGSEKLSGMDELVREKDAIIKQASG